jgi:hypothetical protein
MGRETRSNVYAAIDGELAYQRDLFGENPHEIDALATYIRRYSKVLDEAATKSDSDTAKLEIVRKIAAIAVRCLEQHGAPLRAASAMKEEL